LIEKAIRERYVYWYQAVDEVKALRETIESEVQSCMEKAKSMWENKSRQSFFRNNNYF
jgi:predicted transcriptional regulator